MSVHDVYDGSRQIKVSFGGGINFEWWNGLWNGHQFGIVVLDEKYSHCILKTIFIGTNACT